jgi:hypothetical protein
MAMGTATARPSQQADKQLPDTPGKPLQLRQNRLTRAPEHDTDAT